ncbi:dihydrolipoamide dehydrogenase [Salmonella enterica subsp. enterica serovar Kentucky str. ATCC 9263]|nr:dihydrolipoamide dehydrogenase [Salmonella enterica subsp. enterica serovar Kentucky str. ATCC 9263]
MSTEIKTQVVVLGAGPAGYSAAFRCADLGLETVIVERYNTLGGVCLNVGCIPSKALLHVAKVIEEAKALAEHGIVFGEPKTDIDKIRTWKEKVITQLTGGLAGMAKGRKVKVVNGLGKFTGANTLEVEGENGKTVINFDNAIIAAGSRPIQLPFIPHEDPRVWDSTDALELKEVPKRMLVMGGGIIGLEMGTVYHALGSEIDVVEMFDQVIPAADKDVVKVFTKRISKKFNLMLETKVTAVEAKEDGIYVSMEGKKAPAEAQRYDAVLVAIGRVPNGKNLDAGKLAWKLTTVALSAWTNSCAPTCRTSSLSAISSVSRCWRIKAFTKATLPLKLSPGRNTTSIRKLSRLSRTPSQKWHGLA